MKGYLQPLSEDFVYGSPECPLRGTYRKRTLRPSPSHEPEKRQRERDHVDKSKH